MFIGQGAEGAHGPMLPRDFSRGQMQSDKRRDLPPEAPSFISRVCGSVMCYPTRPRPLSEFQPFDQMHGLVSCADFIRSAGTLCPMALYCRSSL